MRRIHRNTAIAAIGVMVGALFPLSAQAAFASPAPTVASTFAPAARGPIVVKHFWSAILNLFIKISRHASIQMANRNVSKALLERILNDGRIVGQSGGVTKIRYGSYEARVNTNTGNVITVIRVGGGGYGGGR